MSIQDDDQSRQLVNCSQQYPSQYGQPTMSQLTPGQAPAKSGGLMDYIKRNKLTVAIILILIIGLIWWFFFRKGTKVDVTTNVVAPQPMVVPRTVPTVSGQVSSRMR